MAFLFSFNVSMRYATRQGTGGAAWVGAAQCGSTSGSTMAEEVRVRARVVGSLLGLAVCDAVGTAVESMPPGSFSPVTGMQGGGKFSLLPGEVKFSG